MTKIDEEARRAALQILAFLDETELRRPAQLQKVAELITAAYAERLKSERLSVFREAAQPCEKLAKAYRNMWELSAADACEQLMAAIEDLAEKEGGR